MKRSSQIHKSEFFTYLWCVNDRGMENDISIKEFRELDDVARPDDFVPIYYYLRIGHKFVVKNRLLRVQNLGDSFFLQPLPVQLVVVGK